MQLQENQIFASRYMLVSRLGAGGFSEVWLANDMKTGLEVALKIYAPRGGMDDDGVKVFSSEYSGVFNLNHSNLLRPSYYDVEDNCPYLVMPYISNGSAKKYIGSMPEAEVWKFVRDVANGLAYMHSLEPPMIHQDIKPDNVLIDSHGVYQITDFGISVKARSTLRKSAMAAGMKSGSGGTTAYMGPERFSKDPMPIKASDVWSLGATVFELMEGDAPFGDMGGLIQKSGAEIPNFKGEYSKELKDLVTACLATETWDRPFASQLAEYADDMIKGKKPVAPWNHAGGGNNDDGKAKKHGCITAYLIFAVIANLVSAVINAVPISSIGDYAGYSLGLYMTSFLMNVVNVIGFVMLLKNVRLGFWMFCLSCVANVGLSLAIDEGVSIIAASANLLGVGVVALILLIKKNGVSGWKCLKSAKNLKPRFYVISAAILLACVVYAIIYSRNNVYLSVNKTNVSFESDGGTESQYVSAGGDIEVEDYCYWIESYNNGHEVFIKCEENTSVEERSGEVWVTCRNVVKSITVTQNGINPTLELSTSSVNLPVSGGVKTIKVEANCGWTIDDSSTDSWVTASRSGSEINLNCRENTSTESRSTTLLVNYGDKHKKVSIHQAGKEKYLKVNGGTSAINKTFDSGGGRETYTVSCSDSYTTWGVPSWCSIESRTSTSFVLKCSSLESSASRSDYMEVRSNGKSVRINIKQSGKQITRDATINNVWVDHNVYEDGVKGMRIHVKFDVEGMKGRNGRVIAYFRYKNGKALEDKNNSYKTTSGKVCTFRNFSPSYDNSTYNDFTLFMPYDELHLGYGKTDVQFKVSIYDKEDDFFMGNSSYYDFQFTK